MENTQYISLANKYRPQTFEDMVGQESISKTLQNALKTGRIAHAYLFYGPRGCGKTTTARILAKALNCTGNGNTKPTAEPCGKCPQCTEIAQSEDLDVLELDAASNTGVDNVREAIIDTVALAAGRDRFKVFILDEVHMLSSSAFNALLKTIEEPPAHVVFILATTEKHKVPATIVSRCQTFRFRLLSIEEISTHLLELSEAENIDLTASAAKLIAKNAGGSMRDSLTLLDRAIAFAGNRIDEKLVGEMLGLTPEELIKKAIEAVIHKNNTQLHEVFETLSFEGFDANAFLKDIKNTIGDLFYFALGQGAEPFAGAKESIQGVSVGFLAQLSRKINKLIEEVKFSDNVLISAEVGLFTIMDSILDIEGFIRRLEALEKGIPAGNGSGPQQPVRKESSDITVAARANSTKEVKREKQEQKIAPLPQTQMQQTPITQEEIPSLDKAVSNRQIWERLMKHFEKNPFTYDIMLTGKIEFSTENSWTLSFPAGKEFYQITAQNRLKDLSEAASKFSGREIQIVLAKTAAEPENKVPARKENLKEKEQLTPAKAIISDEEPFVKASFEKEVTEKNIPEEIKEILTILPGELLA